MGGKGKGLKRGKEGEGEGEMKGGRRGTCSMGSRGVDVPDNKSTPRSVHKFLRFL